MRVGHLSKRAGPLLVALVAVLAGSGALAAASIEEADEPRALERTPAVSADPEAIRSVAVLSRPAEPGDAMPATAAARLRRMHMLGMNPDLSRLGRSQDGIDFYIVPGTGAVCLATVSSDAPEGAGGTCGEIDAVARGEVVMGGLAPDGVRISGIAPNRAESVTVVLANGREVAADVVGNVYSVEVSESVSAVRLVLAGEQKEVSTPFQVASPSG